MLALDEGGAIIVPIALGASRPEGLAIVLHGVGANAAAMMPVAEVLAAADPSLRVLALDAPEPFDGGGAGRQWFSVRGVTDANRPARVAAALPTLWAFVEAERERHALAPEAVTLVGFSQGAIMTLAAAARGHRFGRAIAIAGRLVPPVRQAQRGAPRITLLHGSDDSVIPATEAAFAACRLRSTGYDVETTISEGTGHSISGDVLSLFTATLSCDSRVA